MLPRTAETISCSELPFAQPNSPLAEEWETYRREIGRLLSEGQEGRFALIRGAVIFGLYDTWDAARRAGFEQFDTQPFMVHPVLRREPVVRGPVGLRQCPS